MVDDAVWRCPACKHVNRGPQASCEKCKYSPWAWANRRAKKDPPAPAEAEADDEDPWGAYERVAE